VTSQWLTPVFSIFLELTVGFLPAQARLNLFGRQSPQLQRSTSAVLPMPARISDSIALRQPFPELTSSMIAGGQKLRGQRLVTNHSSKAQIFEVHRNSGCLFAALFMIRPRPCEVVSLISSAAHVTFLFDRTSYGQPATFKLIGATGERLSQTWGGLTVTVHLLFLNQRGVGFS
jgi:hypothetical protein